MSLLEGRKVCVVGSGAREHALAHVLARSAHVVVTPGNPGICGRSAEGYELVSTPAPPHEIEADLYVIGPEDPLVAGLADRLRSDGRLVFGPGADGARLEGSKEFMKQLANDAGVPTARWGAFSRPEEAMAFLRSLPGPFVVKTDGLAAGKGVLVTEDIDEAERDVTAKLSGESFGAAGRRVVIEEALRGSELSLLVVCDGVRAEPLAPAQDYKRLGTGDTGPNTGGMGAYSPVPIATAAVVSTAMDTIVEPTMAALRRAGIDYRGVLYAGLMLTADGPQLIEYNVRFGDPEAEVVLPRLAADLVDLLTAAAHGRLPGPIVGAGAGAGFVDEAAVGVVVTARGYPEAPRTGDLVEALDDAGSVEGVTVFHAGTCRDDAGALRTARGRVFVVTALGAGLAEARKRAYRGVAKIGFEGMGYRLDIAAGVEADSR
jgi:phosphoribosylamine--glycine ligase